jgi:hypothetical protein
VESILGFTFKEYMDWTEIIQNRSQWQASIGSQYSGYNKTLQSFKNAKKEML